MKKYCFLLLLTSVLLFSCKQNVSESKENKNPENVKVSFNLPLVGAPRKAYKVDAEENYDLYYYDVEISEMLFPDYEHDEPLYSDPLVSNTFLSYEELCLLKFDLVKNKTYLFTVKELDEAQVEIAEFSENIKITGDVLIDVRFNKGRFCFSITDEKMFGKYSVIEFVMTKANVENMKVIPSTEIDDIYSFEYTEATGDNVYSIDDFFPVGSYFFEMRLTALTNPEDIKIVPFDMVVISGGLTTNGSYEYKEKCTVTYDYGRYNDQYSDLNKSIFEFGEPLELDDPSTPNNVYFDGWYYDKNYQNPVYIHSYQYEKTDRVTGDTTIYARFITLNCYAGDTDISEYVQISKTSEEGNYAKKFILVGTPTQNMEGKIFFSWYKDEDLAEKYTYTTSYSGNGFRFDYDSVEDEIYLYARYLDFVCLKDGEDISGTIETSVTNDSILFVSPEIETDSNVVFLSYLDDDAYELNVVYKSSTYYYELPLIDGQNAISLNPRYITVNCFIGNENVTDSIVISNQYDYVDVGYKNCIAARASEIEITDKTFYGWCSDEALEVNGECKKEYEYGKYIYLWLFQPEEDSDTLNLYAEYVNTTLNVEYYVGDQKLDVSNDAGFITEISDFRESYIIPSLEDFDESLIPGDKFFFTWCYGSELENLLLYGYGFNNSTQRNGYGLKLESAPIDADYIVDNTLKIYAKFLDPINVIIQNYDGTTEILEEKIDSYPRSEYSFDEETVSAKEKEGYVFLYWCLEEDNSELNVQESYNQQSGEYYNTYSFGIKFDYYLNSENPIAIFPVYKKEIEINYSSEVASYSTVDDAELPTKYVTPDRGLIIPYLQKDGYIFNGWYTDEELTKSIDYIDGKYFVYYSTHDYDGNAITLYPKFIEQSDELILYAQIEEIKLNSHKQSVDMNYALAPELSNNSHEPWIDFITVSLSEVGTETYYLMNDYEGGSSIFKDNISVPIWSPEFTAEKLYYFNGTLYAAGMTSKTAEAGVLEIGTYKISEGFPEIAYYVLENLDIGYSLNGFDFAINDDTLFITYDYEYPVTLVEAYSYRIVDESMEITLLENGLQDIDDELNTSQEVKIKDVMVDKNGNAYLLYENFDSYYHTVYGSLIKLSINDDGNYVMTEYSKCTKKRIFDSDTHLVLNPGDYYAQELFAPDRFLLLADEPRKLVISDDGVFMYARLNGFVNLNRVVTYNLEEEIELESIVLVESEFSSYTNNYIGDGCFNIYAARIKGINK